MRPSLSKIRAWRSGAGLFFRGGKLTERPFSLQEWRQTLGESFGPQRDVFVGRPSTFDIHSARTNALALKQAADNAAEEANEKEEAAEAARKAQDQVNKALTSVSVSKAGEQRAPAYAPILSQAPASLVGAQQARRKRGEDAAFRAPPQLRTGTLQPPAVRRTPAAAPATNAIKRMAGAASADEFAEPHAKKHRADVSLAQQETPIADHADEQLAAGQVTVNSVKATDHWCAVALGSLLTCSLPPQCLVRMVLLI